MRVALVSLSVVRIALVILAVLTAFLVEANDFGLFLKRQVSTQVAQFLNGSLSRCVYYNY